MKRKLLFSGLAFIFLFSFSSSGQCWPWEKPVSAEAKKPAPAPQDVVSQQQAEAKPAKAQEAVVRPPQAPSKASMEKERARRERVKGILNNTQWEAEVSALSGKGAKQKDNLNFKGNQFYTDIFLDQGFKPSNYTLTLQDNGNAIIETMQTGEAGNIIFWRIEFDPSLTVCKGVLSRQLSDNKSEDYSFVSVAKRPIPPPVSKPEPVKDVVE